MRGGATAALGRDQGIAANWNVVRQMELPAPMAVQSGLTLNWAGERADGTQRLPRDPRLTTVQSPFPVCPRGCWLANHGVLAVGCGIRRAVTAELYRLRYCSRLTIAHLLA